MTTLGTVRCPEESSSASWTSGPLSISSISTAVYFTSRPSKRSFVLRQNGHVVLLKMTT